jgi:hypothetical protein
VLENLLNVDLDLSQDGRRHRIAVALIGKDGHASLDTQRFKDRFRDAKWQAVERSDDNDAVVAFTGGVDSPSEGRNDFTKKGERNMLGAVCEDRRDDIGAGDKQTGLVKGREKKSVHASRVGFQSAETTGKDIESLLDQPRSKDDAIDRPLAPSAVEVPLLGQLHARELGLPLFTIILGLLDGFNPCAMWVLLFLLSMLVNLHDRKKMFLIGGTFVAVSGIVYFTFMVAWYNLFLLIGVSRITQVLLGSIAALIGVLNIKDSVALGWGPSVGIPEAAKPGIYSQVRRVLRAENLVGAVTAVIFLAVLVNTVELLCTAGLPAIFTQVLTMYSLPNWAYYVYLVLYNLAYVADDGLMLAVAVMTLSREKLQEKGARWLKLISGVVMLALGIILMLRPEWLAR